MPIRNRTAQGAFWIAVYLLLILSPLFLLLIGPVPAGRNFWVELSVALGFVALSIMGFQFLITARFRHVAAPYGMDIMYEFHRQISWVAFALIIAHPVILFANNPRLLRLLNVFEAPWRARFGLGSILALLLLIATSIWRKRLGINYESWRVGHGVLGTLAVAFGLAHAVLVNHYLELPWKRVLWIASALFWIGLLVYVRLVKPLLMLRRPYRVTEVFPERGRAHTLVLRPQGHRGFKFAPGQFAWLTLRNSPFAFQEHPFSLSSASTADSGQVAFTIKALGDFTSTISDIRPGERAYLDGPYGAFSVDRHKAAGCVFVAGGVGITPVMSMLRTLADRGDERPLLLIYGSKDWDSITFREELDELKKRLNLQVEHVLTDPPPGWPGESGRVTAEVLGRLIPRDRNTRQYYVCGPDPMMDSVEAALTRLGVSLANIESERYNFI